MMILKRSFGCSGGLWGDGKWLRAVGGGAYFRGITAGVGVCTRVRFQVLLNSLF